MPNTMNFPELMINHMGDLGKRHGKKLDRIAEANDKEGSLIGWSFRTKEKEIDLVFDHAIITINYKFELQSSRLIHRTDEN